MLTRHPTPCWPPPRSSQCHPFTLLFVDRVLAGDGRDPRRTREFFPNGYGIGLYWMSSTSVEVAVLAGTDGAWEVVEDTPVTDDVIRCESVEALGRVYWQIRDLPSR